MKRRLLRTRSAHLVPLLVGAVALTGCDAGVKVNPAAPSVRLSALGTERTVTIVGSLTARQGACVEATILYDGHELADARAACAESAGCARLELSGVARTATGRHTVAFQVLRQSAETVDYVAEVTLRVTRDGSSQVVTVPLDPARVALQSGQVVSFDVYFQNSLN